MALYNKCASAEFQLQRYQKEIIRTPSGYLTKIQFCCPLFCSRSSLEAAYLFRGRLRRRSNRRRVLHNHLYHSVYTDVTNQFKVFFTIWRIFHVLATIGFKHWLTINWIQLLLWQMFNLDNLNQSFEVMAWTQRMNLSNILIGNFVQVSSDSFHLLQSRRNTFMPNDAHKLQRAATN